MENNNFVNSISRKTGESKATVESLIQGFTKIFCECLEQQKSVIIPNLGVFEGKLRREKIAIHPATGKKLLVPPKVSIIFKPSPQLKKRIKNGR